jgi:hypothetical protein
MMDPKQQRQVWQRVYGGHPAPKPIPREGLQQSRARLQQNLQFYQSQEQHPVYGPAFQHLSRQTQEHLQMLQQMLPPPPPPGRGKGR